LSQSVLLSQVSSFALISPVLELHALLLPLLCDGFEASFFELPLAVAQRLCGEGACHVVNDVVCITPHMGWWQLSHAKHASH
jgi:hypothetical protein